jgi:Rod binding domain-containing protein
MSTIGTPLSTLNLTAAGRELSPRRSGPGGRGGRGEGVSSSQADFSEVLTRASREEKTPEEQARLAAEQFVSIAMVQPLLAQLRESNHAAAPFAPSQGEKQFQSLFDAQIAQRITRAKHFPLVDAVAERLVERLKSKAEGPIEPAAAPVRSQNRSVATTDGA